MKWNFEVLNKCRLREGDFGSMNFDTYGAFYIPFESYTLKVIATDGEGIFPKWEHVSVSLPNRTPNWKEMCFIKDLFWGEDEVVLQFHPPKKDYINNHPNCLHLWKSENDIILPPSIFVGIKQTVEANIAEA